MSIKSKDFDHKLKEAREESRKLFGADWDSRLNQIQEERIKRLKERIKELEDKLKGQNE